MDAGSQYHIHEQEMTPNTRDEPLSWSVEALSVAHKHPTIQRLLDVSNAPMIPIWSSPQCHTCDTARHAHRHRNQRAQNVKTDDEHVQTETGTPESKMQQTLDTALASPSQRLPLARCHGQHHAHPHSPPTQLGTAQRSPACLP